MVEYGRVPVRHVHLLGTTVLQVTLEFKRQLTNASPLTHWGRVTHICVNKLTIIGSDNGLSPDRRQAIIWTNAGILLIGPSGTNFSEILIEIATFSFKKIHLKVSSAKRRPFCLGLLVLTMHGGVAMFVILQSRDHSGHGLSQWEETLLCSAFSDWPSSYPEWSLHEVKE